MHDLFLITLSLLLLHQDVSRTYVPEMFCMTFVMSACLHDGNPFCIPWPGQERNERGKGDTIPGHQFTVGALNHFGAQNYRGSRLVVPTMSQVLPSI